MEIIEIKGDPHGGNLQVRTPGQYAMKLAVQVLEFLDEQPEITVKKTGWQRGFGLEVCAWIPITMGTLIAELETDGIEFQIRKASGSLRDFEVFFELVKEFLSKK